MIIVSLNLDSEINEIMNEEILRELSEKFSIELQSLSVVNIINHTNYVHICTYTLSIYATPNKFSRFVQEYKLYISCL